MYDYQTEKSSVFTDDGQRTFLAIRDEAKRLLDDAGAARLDKIIRVVTGDSWTMLACVDRLVELGELRELTGDDVAGQDRVFVSARG